METLITASLGLFAVGSKYYLQIISADKYEFYYVQIDATVAQIISVQESLSVEIIDELPEGMILNED